MDETFDSTLEIYYRRAKEGDEMAMNKIIQMLHKEFLNLAQKKYIQGAETADIIQECRIGAWRAVKDFNPGIGLNFRNFAISVCCERRICSAMKVPLGKKHQIHLKSESFENSYEDLGTDENRTFEDFYPDPHVNVEREVLDKYELERHTEELHHDLSEMEHKVFEEYKNGGTYHEIGDSLMMPHKAVDNAMIRIRKKAKSCIDEMRLGDTLLDRIKQA